MNKAFKSNTTRFKKRHKKQEEFLEEIKNMVKSAKKLIRSHTNVVDC